MSYKEIEKLSGYGDERSIIDKINEVVEALNAEKAERCPDIVSWAKDHYWDSLEKDKGLIVKHIEDNFGKLSTSGEGELEIENIIRKWDMPNVEACEGMAEEQYKSLAHAIMEAL